MLLSELKQDIPYLTHKMFAVRTALRTQTSVASRGYATAAKAQSLKERLAELIPKEIENVSSTVMSN